MQTEKVNQSSIHIGAHLFGMVSQVSLLFFGVLPAEMDKLSPLLSKGVCDMIGLEFQDSIFLDIYFVSAFLFQSYMMYFSTQNWRQSKALAYFRAVVYGLICNVFLLCREWLTHVCRHPVQGAGRDEDPVHDEDRAH